MVMQACKLHLPLSHPSLEVDSLLFEPLSHSLALMHSDSSFLLFPSLSIFSPSPSPSSQTLIPPISTSATFLRLHSNPNSTDGRVLFVVAGPHNGGSRILLRFWILRKNQVFAKAHVKCSQNDLSFDDKLGVVVDLSHGISVKLAGSVNVFALHSVSARKIWVFAAKVAGNEDDCISVNLMKCAVIDCTVPICSITVSLGFLLLGEENGVRVFPLRPLVKGGFKKRRDSVRRRENNNQNGSSNSDVSKNREMYLQNGVIRTINETNDLYCASGSCSKSVVTGDSGKSTSLEETAVTSSNGYTGKTEVNCVSAKHRTVKLKQESGLGGTFVTFKSQEVQSQKSTTVLLLSLKAVSIHPLSQKNILVLDSVGDLHLLSLYNTALGSDITGHMRRLSHTMKVQMLAVLPDISIRMQTVWISDGFQSVHTMSVSDMDLPVSENDKNEREEKLMQSSAVQAIFVSEKIQDVIPLSANAILILGQGNIFAYSIS